MYRQLFKYSVNPFKEKMYARNNAMFKTHMFNFNRSNTFKKWRVRHVLSISDSSLCTNSYNFMCVTLKRNFEDIPICIDIFFTVRRTAPTVWCHSFISVERRDSRTENTDQIDSVRFFNCENIFFYRKWIFFIPIILYDQLYVYDCDWLYVKTLLSIRFSVIKLY